MQCRSFLFIDFTHIVRIVACLCKTTAIICTNPMLPYRITHWRGFLHTNKRFCNAFTTCFVFPTRGINHDSIALAKLFQVCHHRTMQQDTN